MSHLLHEGHLGTPQEEEIMVPKVVIPMQTLAPLYPENTSRSRRPSSTALQILSHRFQVWHTGPAACMGESIYHRTECEVQARREWDWQKGRTKLDFADHLPQHSLLHFPCFFLSPAFFLCISSSKPAFLISLIGCTKNCSTQSLLCVTQIGKMEEGLWGGCNSSSKGRSP